MRLLAKIPFTAQCSINGMGVGGDGNIVQGDMAVMGRFERTIGNAAFVGKKGQLDIGIDPV